MQVTCLVSIGSWFRFTVLSCSYDLFVHALVFGFGLSALIWGATNNGKVVFHSQLCIVSSSCQVSISAQSLVVFPICYLLLYSIS